MSDPFLSMINITAFNWAPDGYAKCDGQELPVNTNQALFSLIEEGYGGDGRTYFNIPDLRGRTPIGTGIGIGVEGQGENYLAGMRGGMEKVVLTERELPSHSHSIYCDWSEGASSNMSGKLFAKTGRAGVDIESYSSVGSNVKIFNDSALPTTAGSSQGHYNIQPSLAINFIIAISGVYPLRD